MKIRTDFVTNSSCACFMAWECDYEELARALLKFAIKEDEYEYVEYGYEYFRINSYGFEAHYKNPSLDGCAYLNGEAVEYLDEDENEIDCPEDHERGVDLRYVLEDFVEDKEYIFYDDLKTNKYAVAIDSCTRRIFGKGSNYVETVETTDGELYKCKDITVIPYSYSKVYKDINGNIFKLNSPEVKPIGHVEYIYDKRFYILYDKDNEIVDLFYEEDLQKFVEEKSLTIDDKKENIYEQGKLVYTVKCTTLDKLMRENSGESHLECGSTD